LTFSRRCENFEAMAFGFLLFDYAKNPSPAAAPSGVAAA